MLINISLSSVKNIEAQWDAMGIDCYISERDGTIKVSKIVVPKKERNKGIGSKAMRLLCDYADSTKQVIILSPSSDFGGSKTRLIAFYKYFDFISNKGRNKRYDYSETMYRKPQ